jgi:hypothetical protein
MQENVIMRLAEENNREVADHGKDKTWFYLD